MSASPLQQPFLDEMLTTIRSARQRVSEGMHGRFDGPDYRIKEAFEHLANSLTDDQKAMIDRIIWDELRGTLHGILVTFDGGTALADRGLVTIQDESGEQFDRHLHELAFSGLTDSELE